MRYLFFLFLLMSSSFIENSYGQSVTAFEVKRGTNISHWLSQSDKRGEERERYFTEEDITKIATMGFDHIRLPVDEEQLWQENGTPNEEAFELLHKALQWCKTANIRVIVDLHILRSHHFNEGERPLWTESKEQEKFFGIWKRLSKRLHKYPNDFLAYELMNEAVAEDPDDWNKLLKKGIGVLRELEPERTIIVGSNRWQSVYTFKDLKIPTNDPNIMLSFHFYEPFIFTHYETSWTFLKDYHGGVRYPGDGITNKKLSKATISSQLRHYAKEYDKQVLREMIQMPVDKASQLGLKLYCGEFGAFSNAPKSDRLRWYKDVVSLLNEFEIGYANWDYKGDAFGLISSEGKAQKKIIEIVTEKKQ